MKIKTSDLSGAALDWAVAKATDTPINILPADNPDEKWQTQLASYPNGPYWPSQDWSQGGPLIEQARIDFSCFKDEVMAITYDTVANGETHLVSACRAIVMDKLGDTVDIPDALT
jgi:hypothetical protein